MLFEFNKLKKLNVYDQILIYLFLISPILILSGNLLINFLLYFTSIFFLSIICFNKINFNLNNKIFYLIFFFFISLLINLIFSSNIELSTPRVLKSFFIIFFVFAFKYVLEKSKSEKIDIIYRSWFLIFLLVIIDLIFEFIIGTNFLGFKSIMPGRLVGFAGSEGNIGNFFYGFSLIFLAYIYQKHPNNFFLHLFLIILLILISFLIGERSNFIRTFIIIILFYFITYKVSIKIKLIPFVVIFSILFLFIKSIDSVDHKYYGYKARYINQLVSFTQKNGLNNFLENSQYGAHYYIAKKITKNYPIFGVGIKNFRFESFKKEYVIDGSHKMKAWGGNTHPHQLHYEFLAETGFFGYFCFLIFIISSIFLSIKNYFREKNSYQLCGILFVISSLIPILPTGSFFSTYTSIIFWINYSLMVGYIKEKTRF